MDGDTQTVLTGGVLALFVIRESFAFAKNRQPTNGEAGKRHAEIVAHLTAIREDTKAIRHYCHEIINATGGSKSAVETMIRLIERLLEKLRA